MHVNVECATCCHTKLLYLTAAVVFIPDCEAQRRSLQCKRPGFLYSYICVYHRPWAPTEPPGQCGAKFRSETIKDKTYNKRHVKSLTFPFKVGGAELHKIYRLLTNALRNYAPDMKISRTIYHVLPQDPHTSKAISTRTCVTLYPAALIIANPPFPKKYFYTFSGR